jgi:hypothetical protein
LNLLHEKHNQIAISSHSKALKCICGTVQVWNSTAVVQLHHTSVKLAIDIP